MPGRTCTLKIGPRRIRFDLKGGSISVAVLTGGAMTTSQAEDALDAAKRKCKK